MTFLKKASMALVAASLVAAPVAATASTAQFSDLRADSQLTDASAMGEGGASTWILALLAAAAVVAGIIIAADGSNNSPTSP